VPPPGDCSDFPQDAALGCAGQEAIASLRYDTFSHWRDKLARSLAPVSVGLVLAGSYSILTTNGGGQLSWMVTAVSVLALLRSKIHPFALFRGGAAVFLLRSLVSA
jgi:hypothetical protein